MSPVSGWRELPENTAPVHPVNRAWTYAGKQDPFHRLSVLQWAPERRDFSLQPIWLWMISITPPAGEGPVADNAGHTQGVEVVGMDDVADCIRLAHPGS